jgi:CheY-like chemotaxis protein
MPGRILIIDDDAMMCQFVTATLAAAGYTVEAATIATEGLARAQAAPPDGILLDLQMPDVDGFEVCRRLRADPRTAGVPVVMLTASEDRDLFRQAKQHGAIACVPKPFRRTSLVATIDSVLAGVKVQASDPKGTGGG